MRAAGAGLTLTAPPIPRTLHMALSGIRDISVIATPPEDRLSIRTFVLPFSEEVIREAVDREIRRGGQVFFVHNRVETLPPIERSLREILPHVRIAVAHGQMDEERLGVMPQLGGLGGGSRIPSHALEIRGGGNLLGKEQSGHIHQVGYEL